MATSSGFENARPVPDEDFNWDAVENALGEQPPSAADWVRLPDGLLQTLAEYLRRQKAHTIDACLRLASRPARAAFRRVMGIDSRSQEKIARACGVSKRSLARYERLWRELLNLNLP